MVCKLRNAVFKYQNFGYLLSHKEPAGHLRMEYTACRCHSITLMKSKIMIWS